MKIRVSKKKPVNEFLGGLFSRRGTADKSKGLTVGAAARDFNQLKSQLEISDDKIGKDKLKSLGLSLTDLYAMIDQTTKLFSGGVGAIRSLGMNKTQAAINLLKQDYDDVVQKAKQKKLSQNEANEVIGGIASIASTIFRTMPPMMEGEQMDEALGMQRKAVQNFLKAIKYIDDKGNATLANPADPSAAVQAAMQAVPPPPPPEAIQPAAAAPVTPAVSAAPQKEISPEEKQDKINTYSKMASKQVQTKLNKMITPADAQKVVQILMNKNYLNEQLTYDSLVDELVKQTGMEKDVVVAILDSLQNSFKGELQKLSFDKEREQFSGMGVNESLNENLISRKKDVLFSDDDAKRFKLLAGLL